MRDSMEDHLWRVWSWRLVTGGISALEGIIFSFFPAACVLPGLTMLTAGWSLSWMQPSAEFWSKVLYLTLFLPLFGTKDFPAVSISGNSLSFAVKLKSVPSAARRPYQCFSVSVSSYSWVNRCSTASSEASWRCLQEIFATSREDAACLRTSRQHNSFNWADQTSLRFIYFY